MEVVVVNKNDDDNTVFIIIIFLLFLLIFFLFFGGRKSTGGGGGGGGGTQPSSSECIDEPDTSTGWEEAAVDEASFTFAATNTNITIPYIKNTLRYTRFITNKNDPPGCRYRYSVMNISNGPVTLKESSCTDYIVHYKADDTGLTLLPEENTEMTPETQSGGCPRAPYQYCSTDGDIQLVYVSMGCPASLSLLKKLIAEGKLSGYDDERIIKCCEQENRQRCLANGIVAFPVIECGTGQRIQGYCP